MFEVRWSSVACKTLVHSLKVKKKRRKGVKQKEREQKRECVRIRPRIPAPNAEFHVHPSSLRTHPSTFF